MRIETESWAIEFMDNFSFSFVTLKFTKTVKNCYWVSNSWTCKSGKDIHPICRFEYILCENCLEYLLVNMFKCNSWMNIFVLVIIKKVVAKRRARRTIRCLSFDKYAVKQISSCVWRRRFHHLKQVFLGIKKLS